MFYVFPVQKTVSVTDQSDPGNLTVRLFFLELAGALVGFSENITKRSDVMRPRDKLLNRQLEKKFLQSEAITTFAKGDHKCKKGNL